MGEIAYWHRGKVGERVEEVEWLWERKVMFWGRKVVTTQDQQRSPSIVDA